MRLPFLKTKDPAPSRPHVGAAAAGSGDALVDAARTRARQRLAGALVLLATGVIGFPLLFETQPRPLAVDTPIEVLRQDGNRVTTPAAAKAPSPSLPPADAGIEVASEAAGPATMPASALADSAVAAVVLGGRAASAPASAPAAAPPVKASAPARAESRPAAVDDASATRPAVDGVAAGRFVVQAGAYSEASRLREARQKVEKLGLKTYTQVIESASGQRTRVRVGPFATREEAQAVAAKVKAAGIQASVVSL